MSNPNRCATHRRNSNDGVMEQTEGGGVKVLHVIASMAPEWGGTAVAVAGLTKALAEHGVYSEVVTTHESEGELLPTPHLPRHCFRRGLAARVWSAYSRPLAAHLERTIADFDIVHVHGLWHFGGLIACRIARRKGVPYVVSLRGEMDGRRLRYKRSKKRIYRALFLDRALRDAAALHAVSTAECQHVAALGLQTPVFVCPNGVDLAQFDELAGQHRNSLLRNYRQLQNRRVVLYLGRIESLKGLDVLAQAFAYVAAKLQDVVLLVAGRDEDGTLADVQRTLREAGVADRMVFTGFLTGSRKFAALACADLFVLPSYSEGFSKAVLEALAAGLPVVISEQCNFPEVERAKAGFVVPSKSTSVADAIATILADADLAKRMANNARGLIEAHYQWSVIAGRMAQHYVELRDAGNRSMPPQRLAHR